MNDEPLEAKEIVVSHPLTPEEIAWKTSSRIAKTEFVPDSFRNRPDAVFAAVLYGRELGFGPMRSLNSLNVIKGKVSLQPEAMRALVFAAGHRIESSVYTDEQVVLIGTRSDGSQATTKWTMGDARRAGLVKGGDSAWGKYPRAMLLARATSELCRLLFPDVISGASYTPDELDEDWPQDEPISVDNGLTSQTVDLAVDGVESQTAGVTVAPVLPPSTNEGTINA